MCVLESMVYSNIMNEALPAPLPMSGAGVCPGASVGLSGIAGSLRPHARWRMDGGECMLAAAMAEASVVFL